MFYSVGANRGQLLYICFYAGGGGGGVGNKCDSTANLTTRKDEGLVACLPACLETGMP